MGSRAGAGSLGGLPAGWEGPARAGCSLHRLSFARRVCRWCLARRWCLAAPALGSAFSPPTSPRLPASWSAGWPQRLPEARLPAAPPAPVSAADRRVALSCHEMKRAAAAASAASPPAAAASVCSVVVVGVAAAARRGLSAPSCNDGLAVAQQGGWCTRGRSQVPGWQST